MTLRKAAVIPWCDECKTHFAHKCKHFMAQDPRPFVWEVDDLTKGR